MKKKILGIFVCMLLIATVIPVVGDINRTTNDVKRIEDKILIFDEYNEIVPGEFIVKFTDESALSSPSITALNKKHQVKSIEKVFKNAENTILDKIYAVRVPKDSDIMSIVKDYSSCPDIVYAEPNGVFHLCINNPDLLYASSEDIAIINGIPNDEDFGIQWALHNIGQNIRPDPLLPIYGTSDADIDAPEAWNIETGDSDIVIAIIDSGIDYTHPDLADNIWVNGDEIPDNGIDDDSNGYIDDVMGWDFYYHDNDLLDGSAHGTHCAGIASAVSDNNIGIAGVCWNCKIMPVQTFNETGDSSETICAKGVKYAVDNGADVISMSFAVDYYPDVFMPATEYAHSKGVFLCAAAGNHNTSQEYYPAASENVTAVAATNQHDERCDDDDWDPYNWYTESFGSNYGDWVDVAAPGNLIYSTMPTYHVYFNNYWNAWRGLGLYYQQDYDYWAGTSMATPHVAGLAALLISRNPDLSPDEVHSIICDEDNVDPYDSEEYIGTGRINAYKALKAMFGDIDYDGSLSWTDVKPGATVTSNFTIENIGLNGSLLDWKVTNCPTSWGEWTFSPESGIDLTPEDGDIIVEVIFCVAPDLKNKELESKIKVQNLGDTNDFCYINVSLTTPKNKPPIFNFPLLNWLFERFSNIFPILRYLVGQ